MGVVAHDKSASNHNDNDQVTSDTRDRLKALAAERRETIGSTVEYLLEERLRLHRFEQLAADIAATPARQASCATCRRDTTGVVHRRASHIRGRRR